MTLAERFTQVMDSMPWVRCASGNVSDKFFQKIKNKVKVPNQSQQMQFVKIKCVKNVQNN